MAEETLNKPELCNSAAPVETIETEMQDENTNNPEQNFSKG